MFLFFIKQGFKQSNVYLYLQNAKLNNAFKEAKNYNSVTNATKSTTTGCEH